jgi:hypothetical protein
MNYTKQAQDFLERTNTTYKATYINTGYHFDDDKHKRDRYLITFIKGDKTMTLIFGDSIANTEKRAQSRINKPPSAYSVLACLTKYQPESLLDFVRDYGYPHDTREELKRAEHIYRKVCIEWDDVTRMWNDEELELLREIQ